MRKEFREEIRSLKDEIRRQVSKALENSGPSSIRVDLQKDDVAQAEPSFVVVKDLVRQIREDVKSSLATRGEIAVDELVDGMPETTAADLLKSLANTDRLKMVKMLYSTRKTFSDFKTATGLEAASVNNHLKSLLNMGLVSHSDEGGYELTKRGRILTRTLALMSKRSGEKKLIEIGRDSRIALATRRTATTLGGISAILALVWLIRGPLGLQQYSASILLAGMGLFFLGRGFRTETNSGPGRAVASLLWNLSAAFVGIILSIWILGWVASLQSDVYPTVISSRVPILAVGAITAGLGAYAVQRLGLTRRWTATPFVVLEGKGPTMEGTKLAVKQDTVGMPIRREGRTIGCVLMGEVSTTFKTPMGTVSASLPGPVTTIGIPFQGKTTSNEEVVKMTGKSANQ